VFCNSEALLILAVFQDDIAFIPAIPRRILLGKPPHVITCDVGPKTTVLPSVCLVSPRNLGIRPIEKLAKMYNNYVKLNRSDQQVEWLNVLTSVALTIYWSTGTFPFFYVIPTRRNTSAFKCFHDTMPVGFYPFLSER